MVNARYQLFKILPDREIIDKILGCFGIKELEMNYNFTKRDLERYETVKKLEEIREEIRKYYLECKYKRFMNNLDEKKSITVLKHFLKVMNYGILTREKYSEGHKYLVYNLKYKGEIERENKLHFE